MTDRERLWTLVQEAMQAFGPFYRDAMQKAIQDSGVPDNWFALSLARGSDPAPFTVECFHAMSPYTAWERSAKALEELIESLTVNLLVRLVPRSLSVISMVVSSHSNHEIMEHSGNTAFMVYRKRFIERKKDF